MKKLRQLLVAARALAPQVEIRIRGTDDENLWVCTVSVGGAILFQSDPGDFEDVVDLAAAKLRGMSQKMRKVLSTDEELAKKAAGNGTDSD